MVVLPSSFSGSPQALQQSFIDAMAILQKYGKPDLFITMTCNPKWKEIVENLKLGQIATNRPHLVARVFHQKVKQLKEELVVKAVFEKCAAYVYVVEFQKRGLPHVHMLFWLEEDSKIHDADDVDEIVSAEIPDKTRYPLLHDIVKQCMIHGPCSQQNMNSPCMDVKTNRCTKQFPKDYVLETNYHSKGYPMYRRRDDGNIIVFNAKKDGTRRTANNGDVVPYHAYLLLKFNSHINVEICSTVQCIKYLFKYCYKGHDCAIVEMENVQGGNNITYNEVDEYISTRYVCPPEAMYRLYEYPITEQSHAICIVTCRGYVPGQQPTIVNCNRSDTAKSTSDGCLPRLRTGSCVKHNEDLRSFRLIGQEPNHRYNATAAWMHRRRRTGLIVAVYKPTIIEGLHREDKPEKQWWTTPD
ncbi:uncharacterized protein LOC124406215 [Diprion similis]|uniref:uncharacterized protein LOC124406215 n=1 Tax=Diprion similis TaxID=362088 RepID=UPI001EF8E97D|nr:uncharacterized protein LOC124406215 [Diprion similis]